MFRRPSILLGCAAVLFVSACGESSLPNPTGKGAVRGINAIPASPTVAFRIEERTLGALEYKDATDVTDYDDFTYNFNFDIRFPGDEENTRIATQTLKVDVDREYTFVVHGTTANPVVTVWEGAVERTWEDTDTVFELKFGHVAASFGEVDIYFVPQGDAAGPGNLAASIAFGDVSPPADLTEGTYTIVVTTRGDINDVLYRSNEIDFIARLSLLVALFDGDENDLGPLAVRAFQPSGSVSTFSDAATNPSVRLIHASIDLGNVDVYDDELLASRIVANQAFGEFSGDIPATAGVTTFTYTPPDDTGVVLIESDIGVADSQRINIYAIGQSGSHVAVPSTDDRRSVSVEARLRLYNASSNHNFVDLYVVEDGAAIDEFTLPVRSAVSYASSSGTLAFAEGEWDVYVTALADRDTVLDGPFDLTLSLGDIVNAVLLDTTDPATAEIRIIPPP